MMCLEGSIASMIRCMSSPRSEWEPLFYGEIKASNRSESGAIFKSDDGDFSIHNRPTSSSSWCHRLLEMVDLWHWHGRGRPLHSPTRNTPSAIRFVEWSARIDNQLPLSQSLPPVLEHIQNDSMYERGSIWCIRMDGSSAGVGRIGR